MGTLILCHPTTDGQITAYNRHVACKERIINTKHLASVLLSIAISGLSLNCNEREGPTQPAVPDPIASFTYEGTRVTPATIMFQNTSQYADSFLWEFGDNTGCADSSPSKLYETAGAYSVKLTACRVSTGKTHSVTQQLVIDPGRVFVDVINAEEIPFTKTSGLPWDLGSGPDLYITLNDNAGEVKTFRSKYYEDVTPVQLPVGWPVNPKYEITDWSKPYHIVCWDLDTFEADDYIGATDGFTVNSIVSLYGYAHTVALQNSDGTVKSLLHLDWH